MGSITPEWLPQVLKEAGFATQLVSLRIYWKYFTLFTNCGTRLLCSKVENSIFNVTEMSSLCISFVNG